MRANELLKFFLRGCADVEDSGIVTIGENADVSHYFPITDECSVESGEYVYIYVDDEESAKMVEEFLEQPFDYLFPTEDRFAFVGLVRNEG